MASQVGSWLIAVITGAQPKLYKFNPGLFNGYEYRDDDNLPPDVPILADNPFYQEEENEHQRRVREGWVRALFASVTDLPTFVAIKDAVAHDFSFDPVHVTTYCQLIIRVADATMVFLLLQSHVSSYDYDDYYQGVSGYDLMPYHYLN